MSSVRFKLTGDTESKFAQVERYMGHLNRRSVKVAEVIIPAVPLSGYILTPEEDGTVFRFLASSNGELKNVIIYLGKVDKDSAPVVEIEVAGPTGKSTYTCPSLRNIAGYDGTIPVRAGDRITVFVRYVQKMNRPDEPSVQEVWTGLAFVGEKESGSSEKVLLDKVLEEAEGHEGV